MAQGASVKPGEKQCGKSKTQIGVCGKGKEDKKGEGEVVKVGHILCMIEAMKVFNEIKAEYPCTVLKVLLENGKPVKAGQDLILVQRS